jgi:alanyl-tRNA synthetase
MAAIMSVPVEEVVQKAEQNQAAIQKAAKEIAEFRSKLAMAKFADLQKKAVEVADANVLAIQVPDATPDTLRAMADKFKEEHPNAIGVFSTVLNDQAVFIVNVADEMVKRGIKAGDIAKQISAVAGGSGGGRPTMAQAGGKIPEKIPESLDLALKLIREKLGK